MKGFVVYQTYRVIDGRPYVTLFGRLENGQSFVTMNYYRPYFYIKELDLKKAQKTENFEHEKTEMKTFEGEKAIKIILDMPKESKEVRQELNDNNIPCYEADILFAQRYLMDKGIIRGVEIKGDHEQGEYVDRVYKEPEIKASDYWPELKILSLDIETDFDTKQINAISVVCGNKKETYLRGSAKIKGAISCKTEEELLIKFTNKIRELDPDVITGWNVIDFDFAVICDRLKEYGLQLEIGRDNTPSRLRIETNFFRNSKLDVPGRMVLDGMALMKASFLSFSNYKLDTVAQEVLKDKKLIQFENKGKELDDLFKKNPEKYAEYNLKDAQLVLDILNKSGMMNYTIKRSTLTGLPLDSISASIASLDSLYIREANKRGLVVPSLIHTVKERGILGGYVRESQPGIYDNVIVLDFKSLYPSIMRTFNIDPASYVKEGKGKNLVKAPNGACFRNEEGILPEILEKLWIARDEAKKNKDELQRYAIKILMNSFFGALASPNSRFFNMEVANAITHYGQYIIKLTAEQIEKKGYEVIYSDTDSCFVLSKTKDYDKATKIGEKLQSEINSFYDKMIKEEYKRDSHLYLEFEKCYVKFLMPKIRGQEKGAKKRYAGMLIKDCKEELEVVGLEAVRGDWTQVAQKFQKELLLKIFNNEPFEKYISDFVKDLKKGKYDNSLIYRKQLRKGLEGYAVKTQHLKAAMKLDNFQGGIVEYVITEDGPEPIQSIKHRLDYNHYINKQIKPIADMILTFFDITFEELLNGNKQVSLLDYK